MKEGKELENARIPSGGKSKPLVVSFAVQKRENNWHAIALKSQGREILEERILESDDTLAVAVAAVDRAEHELWHFHVDPFSDKPRDR